MQNSCTATFIACPSAQRYHTTLMPSPNNFCSRFSDSPSNADINRIAHLTSLPLFLWRIAFNSSFVAVFAWFAVGPHRARTDVLNTFQVILAS